MDAVEILLNRRGAAHRRRAIEVSHLCALEILLPEREIEKLEQARWAFPLSDWAVIRVILGTTFTLSDQAVLSWLYDLRDSSPVSPSGSSVSPTREDSLHPPSVSILDWSWQAEPNRDGYYRFEVWVTLENQSGLVVDDIRLWVGVWASGQWYGRDEDWIILYGSDRMTFRFQVDQIPLVAQADIRIALVWKPEDLTIADSWGTAYLR